MTAAEARPLPARTLLQLIWLASPALPVGGFSYSEALEAAIDGGLVVDAAGAERWLLDQLELVLVRAELPLVAAARSAWDAHDAARVEALNDWCLQTRETAEQRLQAEQMGRSLGAWLRQQQAAAADVAANADVTVPAAAAAAAAVEPDARLAVLAALRPAPAWPVAFALAAARAGAPAAETLLAFGFGWAENMVQAAVKALPLGQAAGQRVLAALADALPAAVQAALAIGDAGRQAFAPGLAIVGARHETQYSRLFRS